MVTVARGNVTPSYANGYALNASQSENPELWDGLEGLWLPILGFASEQLNDKSGKGRHITFPASPSRPQWGVDHVLFDGSDDLLITDQDGVTASPLTMGVWVQHGTSYTNSSERHSLITLSGSGDDADNFFRLLYHGSANELRAQIFDGTTSDVIGFAVDPGTTERHFYGVTIDSGATVELYYDGKPVASGSQTVTPSNVSRVEIADSDAQGSSAHLDGKVYQGFIYNRALTSATMEFLFDDIFAIFRRRKRVWMLHMESGITVDQMMVARQLSGLQPSQVPTPVIPY